MLPVTGPAYNPTTIIITSQQTLTQDTDIGDNCYQAGPSFTGIMFYNPNGYKFYSSTGRGLIDGCSRANGYAGTKDTNGAECYGITFRMALDVSWFGGNIFLQTGGANYLHDCTFLKTRLIYAGIAPRLEDLRFYRSNAQALRTCNGTLGSGSANWAINSVSGAIVRRITFEECYTDAVSTITDNGVFYMGRRICSDHEVVEDIEFINCHKVACFYLDDGISHMVANRFTFTNCYRDYLINGGFRVYLTDFVSDGCDVASVWSDILSKDNGTGGAYGSHYGNGQYHANWPAHNGAAWSHGGVSGDANAGVSGTTMTLEYTQITGAGAEAWLARLDAFFVAYGGYVAFMAAEATNTTTGTLDYTYTNGVAPTFNASSATPTSLVVATVNGVLVPPA